ncbi:hypothetical protein HYP71_gp021 [Arthrobacter phage KBurrousTX]|uniref:Uncharacterized protein n=1 Tax=Arthrobacter phage KBurrousTX TaxID=2315608 RepID=A0A386K8G5_9CAUD|nr:hypothetical protein HYP71_gp021 [Arthrobacter phage KBurrousTX]AYD81515.1 hypothetical protein KBurrousTX_21 [Arthrobacter phage KBurrousTX]
MAVEADILRLDPVTVVDEPNRFYRAVRSAAAYVVAEYRAEQKKQQQR